MEKYSALGFVSLNQTQKRMLMYLKMHGAQPAAVLAGEMGLTNEGARQHLMRMMEEGWISSESQSKGVGRPIILYKITAAGFGLFPDAHAELTLQLLTSVKALFGQEGLDRLIQSREQETLKQYQSGVEGMGRLEDRLDYLVSIRSAEGYMAEWYQDGDLYFLVENHCPICAAATRCQGFCQAELQNFRQTLGEGVKVERVEHIVQGARRCAYQITTLDK
ncbi:metalloregulator ArsR/SmtB family transcription factor [Marinoscillum sp. 108]|uniref:helix-turn-helix transcriptional regulator n=1 Tax=Marinoscillum sp. 108 TaxID=2653151 RepID=UPI0012F1D6AD|nr:metalloregulator ArsR/SmtB family transcription factor [Marinoscillum sp. 108]VXD10997.1 MarR family transcriptional regulator [Marinoscillum sp. 108]